MGNNPTEAVVRKWNNLEENDRLLVLVRHDILPQGEVKYLKVFVSTMNLQVLVDFMDDNEAMREKIISLASTLAPGRGDGAASAAILLNSNFPLLS